MDRRQELQSIDSVIQKAQRIFVQGHANCGDALGSTLAMVHYLESLNKEYVAFSPAPIPEQFRFMPKTEVVVTDVDEISLSDFDLLLILDCGDLERTGMPEKMKSGRKADSLIINIDHHYTNNYFGDINFVDTSAPSTTTLIHEFFQANNIPVTKQIAACLMVGIFTDTGIFTNPATNQSALDQAAELLMAGVNINQIFNSILKNRTVHGLKLWGKALTRLTLNEEYNIAYTVILQKDFQECPDCSFEDIEGLSNFLNNLHDASVTVVIREDPDNKVKFSFRTTRSDRDVGTLAAYFGGGGHKKAAGFTIDGRLDYDEKSGTWRLI